MLSVAGTHDNETVVGWWQGSANEGEKAYFKEYLGVDGKDPAWALLKESLKSVSQTAIMLMQASLLNPFASCCLSFPLLSLPPCIPSET